MRKIRFYASAPDQLPEIGKCLAVPLTTPEPDGGLAGEVTAVFCRDGRRPS